MNPPDQTPGTSYAGETNPEPISVSHFVHTMKGYRVAIILALIAVALAYSILAIFVYLRSPSRRITTQRFRLDFEGSTEARYPNGARFGIADVISGPILQRVHHDNQLADVIGFSDFTRSIFVLESNTASEILAAEYQARLADPKLTPVDRDRVQSEYELKRQSISKNEYSVNFVRRAGLNNIPEPIARKVLLDILNGWADNAVNQQQVLAYRISVLSPAILKPSAIELNDPIAAIEVLRRKATIVMTNIREIEGLPSGNLVRTPGDRISLPEVRLRLEEIIRFRLEPLVVQAKTSGLITDPVSTTRFIETQLAYDQRQLKARQAEAETIRNAIAIYEQTRNGESAAETSTAGRSNSSPRAGDGGETVMPQFSDTFLDRLMRMTDRGADLEYRQRIVDQYRDAVKATIPAEQAVAYDTQLLNQLRTAPVGSTRANPAAVRAQIDDARAEVAQLIEKSNELYKLISLNMTPSTHLFTLTSPPTTAKVRTYELSRLGLYGILALLVTLPVIVAAALLHNRIREEEVAEGYVEAQPTPSPR